MAAVNGAIIGAADKRIVAVVLIAQAGKSSTAARPALPIANRRCDGRNAVFRLPR